MDIVERLRGMVGVYIGDADIDDDLNNAADEIERLRKELLQIKQQSMETHTRAMAHQALYQNEARILATNTYEAEGRN